MTTEVLATSFFSLPDCIHDLRWRIDAALEDSLRLSPGCPATLRQAMEYALLAPGKRIRPLLTLLAAQACGGPVERAHSSGLCRGDGSRLFAGARRFTGDGQRRLSPREIDLPQTVR